MFKLKQNDTLPHLQAQLLDYNDELIDLALCGVKFHMKNGRGNVVIDRAVDVDDEANGKVSVKWREEETKVVGKYQCEFQVTLPDGNIITVPNDGYIPLMIVPEIA